ncbi:FAD-dependent oxidoreductase, partial [Acinetobacter baumannii]
SFFSYDPRVGAEIFASWVRELPNLHWIAGKIPLEVLKESNKITGVKFADLTVTAKITLDGTELGDLLALAEIPHRWG